MSVLGFCWNCWEKLPSGLAEVGKRVEVWNCWVATLPSHMKNLPDNENSRVESRTERQRKTNSWLCTRVKHVWSQFYHWTFQLNVILYTATASANTGFYHLQFKGYPLMQLYNHSDWTPISNQISLQRAF